MKWLFALALFLSAGLSFLVEPLMGKQLLPVLGGTPGVWNTCLVFFQIILLVGYFLAHLMTRPNLTPRVQLASHWGLLALAIAVLWLGGKLLPNFGIIPTDSESPTLAVLAVLATSVGLPFLLLSMSAPLLQKWYSRFGANPYPLYAASNLGSFAGLLAYPLVVEPSLRASEQRSLWCTAFTGTAVLLVLCGWFSRNRSSGASAYEPNEPDTPPNAGSIVKWVALSALPSSLLMSVTTHLTTDIAPVPLLWVVPLGLYLLSFVIVFAGWSNRSRKIVSRVTPMLLCFLTVALLMRANTPMILVGSIHLLTFFFVALLCHGELAANRPSPRHLTSFYLWLSVGGVVGGLVNTFLAPVVFAQLGNLEYPIAIVLAGLVRPPDESRRRNFKSMDGIWPFGLGIFTALLVVGVPWLMQKPGADPAEQMIDRMVRGGLSFGIPAAIAFALVWQPKRFALCLGVVFLVGSFAPNPHGRILETHRNYFGTLRVSLSEDGRFHRIVHGTTLHGTQLVPTESRPEPATYYHRRGPFGNLMACLPAERRQRVGVVGLGCGATAAYAEDGQHWSFYEIDPAVVRVAQNPRYFTFLSNCPAKVNVILGDARQQLRAARDGEYQVLVLDAFSSDAVPVHLLTQEAFELYFQKLKPDGVLALHLSNRYLDLPQVVARVLHQIDPNLVVRIDVDTSPSDEGKESGQEASEWVVVSRRVEDLGRPSARWQTIPHQPGPIWTDDFSNLLSAWKKSE